jgi:O-antigen/teichoic acid export membrane protein
MKSTRPQLLRAGLLVGGGTAAGQAVLFLTSLVVVRLFSPEEMGLFTTLSSISACLVALFTGRFELAIPLPRGNRDSVNLARLAIGASSISATLLCLALMITPTIFPELRPGHMSVIFWALPSLIMGVALFQVGSQVAVRTENYKAISRRAMIFPAVTGTLQIGAGLLQLGTAGLVLSVCLGQLTLFLSLWIPASKSLNDSEGTPVLDAWQLAKRYKRFPLVLGPAGVLNALATQLPQILVAILYGLAAAGQLGVAMRIVALPVVLIGQSLSYVYNGEIAKRVRNSDPGILHAFDKLSLSLAGISAAVAAALYTLSPLAFPMILGTTWTDAGKFASILALGVAMQLLVAPLSQTLTISGWLGAQLTLDILRSATIAGCFAAAYLTEAPVESYLLYVTMGMTITYAALWVVNRKAAKALDRRAKTPPLAEHSALPENLDKPEKGSRQ